MNVRPNPIKLVKSFSDVKSDMSRMDGNLTQWEHNGRTYPGSTTDDRFREMARDLDEVTLGLSDLHPSEEGLLSNLKRDTLNLGFNAGMTNSMSQRRTTFGSGWRNTMDPGIADADRAIDVITQAEESEAKAPPSPMKVLKDLSDVRADLTRWDANFTQWENDRNTYPGHSVSKSLMGVAGDLYDARNDFRALHPEQSALLNDLRGDIIKVSSNAGSTKHMYNHSVTFGSGWRRSLDHSIQSVRQAIDVIVDSQDGGLAEAAPEQV
jgi:hypothetical protein